MARMHSAKPKSSRKEEKRIPARLSLSLSLPCRLKQHKALSSIGRGGGGDLDQTIFVVVLHHLGALGSRRSLPLLALDVLVGLGLDLGSGELLLLGGPASLLARGRGGWGASAARRRARGGLGGRRARGSVVGGGGEHLLLGVVPVFLGGCDSAVGQPGCSEYFG